MITTFEACVSSTARLDAVNRGAVRHYVQELERSQRGSRLPRSRHCIKEMASIDVEDILNDALELVGGESADMEDEKLTYGPITVNVAPKVCDSVLQCRY